MLVWTKSFELQVPDDWRIEEGEGPLVAHSRDGLELIISVAAIEGEEVGVQRSSARDLLLQNALEAAQRAAAHPELAVFRPLATEDAHSSMRCWVTKAQTMDTSVFFGQAVIAATKGVMLLSLEGARDADSEMQFDAIVASARER